MHPTTPQPERASFPKGPTGLRREVLDPGLCTACGMCLGLCPYLAEMGENVTFLSDCRREEGRCYEVCPRTRTDVEGLRRLWVPGRDPDFVLGPHRSVWLARATDKEVRRVGQYGGTVTALVALGLEGRHFETALLTRWSADPAEPYLPVGAAVRTAEEARRAAGSKYTACATLKLLDETVAREEGRVCVVGRPCQVTAMRKRMGIEDPTFRAERVTLAIGLFCMWALSYRPFRNLLASSLPPAAVPERLDVPKGRFLVETDRGSFELPHDEVRALARPACATCYDFTAELADLSVGSTEWKDDWNTLIVRTEAGQALVEAAERAGRIERSPFPADRLRLLRKAAFDKKKRALEELERREADGGPPSHLRIPEEERRFFLEADGLDHEA